MKKLFAILIVLSLSIPVLAIDESELMPVSTDNFETVQSETLNESEQEVGLHDDNISVPQQLPVQYKQPMGKKKLAKKFIIAMLCVAGCSVLMYGTLAIYNKIRETLLSSSQIEQSGDKALEESVDLTDAIKTFIDKTHWN